jgi:hypothetical protein
LVEHHSPKFKFLTHCMYMNDQSSGYEVFCDQFWDPPGDGFSEYEYSNSGFRFAITVWGLNCE